MALFINGVGQNSFNIDGISIDNLYVDDVLVWSSAVEASIPRYEFTEALVDTSTIDDSANTLDTYNGLLTESDGTTPYEPTALQYPQNGLLELANGRIMDTQYTRQQLDGQYGIYDADGSTTYKIWALQWTIGSNYVVWEGDQDTPLYSTGEHDLVIPEGTMKITDGRPSWLPSLGWEEAPLPDVAYNVTDYGLIGDGVEDDTAALNALALDTDVTNWYFPEDKSFVLFDVKIPTHLNAVYGGGTILARANTLSNTIGSLTIDHDDNDGLIIDGINFSQASGTWSGTNNYGLLTLHGTSALSNFEIRNCDFQIPYHNMKAVKMFGSTDPGAIIDGVHIHNNTFTAMTNMALEIWNYDHANLLTRSMIDIHVHDNIFTGPSASYSLSFVGVRGGVGNTGVADGTESYLYNNTFTDVTSALEVGHTSGVRVHNNYATGVTSSLYSSASNTEDGMNFIYNNHLEGVKDSKIYLYNMGNGEFYDNFIGCLTEVNNVGYTENLNYDFHDNTIVYDISGDSASWTISPPDFGAVTWDNNEMYTSVGVSRIFYLGASKGGLDNVITNNDFNMVHPTGVPIDNLGDPITESGNTTVLDYAGAIPTSRPGAGLLP